jgi:hypothetical protein
MQARRLQLRGRVRPSLSSLVAAVALAIVGAAAGARAAELPTPDDARLRGTVESDALREMPELKGARENLARDLSVGGVHVRDQTWESDLAYADLVRFYDRALVGALLLERDEAETATGWTVKLDDGSVASVTLRNTRPTTIEIQRIVP